LADPDLYEQTIELGKSLKTISDRNPEGKPSQAATTAFRSWLAAVSGSNSEPRYFEDIAENYDIAANSNKDIFTIFELLHPYVDFPDVEEPAKTFIGLPMA
jgi:hypothetical protein